jgi:NADH-quinone oxidoreductase subunit J
MSPAVFYILGASAVIATLLAIISRETMRAVIYAIMSFFALALIFYMMGAPLVAVLEVIVYAGAIMVLFLFIVMMLDMGTMKGKPRPFIFTWGPAIILGAVILASSVTLMSGSVSNIAVGASRFISPREFGEALYTRHMLAVEVVSLLLLFALVGAHYLGRKDD